MTILELIHKDSRALRQLASEARLRGRGSMQAADLMIALAAEDLPQEAQQVLRADNGWLYDEARARGVKGYSTKSKSEKQEALLREILGKDHSEPVRRRSGFHRSLRANGQHEAKKARSGEAERSRFEPLVKGLPHHETRREALLKAAELAASDCCSVYVYRVEHAGVGDQSVFLYTKEALYGAVHEMNARLIAEAAWYNE